MASALSPPSSSGFSGSASPPGESCSELRENDRKRLEAIPTDSSQSPEAALREFLQIGRKVLGVQNAHLSQINPGTGTHTVVALEGSCATLQEGDVNDLSSTYCRSIIASNDLLSLHDAPNEGWAGDPAHATFGFGCYVGTKVLLGTQLYGTVCFASPAPRVDPFSPADHALVCEIARRIGQCLRKDPFSERETEVEQDRDFLQRVQALSRVGGWEFDVPTGNLRWTETTYDLYELPQTYEPELESAISFFAEEAQPKLRAALDRCAEDGISYDLELPLITADGTRRWVRARGVPSHKNGMVTCITGTIEDITAEKEAQRTLEKERDRFETLFQSLPTPVARCRVEERATLITAINEAFEEVFGVSGSSVEGGDVNELLAPADQQRAAQRLSERALEEGTLQVEAERQTAEGLRDFRLQVAGHDRPDAPPEVYAIYTDVTELKERERTIRKERDLLNRVLETSPTAIVIFDADGNFVRASDRAQEIFGMETPKVMERAYNDPAWHITTPNGDPLPDHELPFARVKNSEEPVIEAKHTIEWPDGTRRLLSVSGAPLHDANESFVGAVFHLDDITEQRQTRLSLAESERRFRGVFENAGLGIAIIDDSGHLIDVNPALASMMGRSPDALRGHHFERITHPDDVEMDKRQFERVIENDLDSYQVEKRYVRPDGSSFWGHLTVSRLEGGETPQFIGMVENIDLRKTQREELRKFQTVVEHAHEGVLILAEGPRSEPGPPITYANSSVESLTGYAPSEVTGNSLGWLFGTDTEPWVLHDLWASLEQGRRHEGEALAYHKDGTPFVAHWSIAPVHGEEGVITHWVAVLRDISEKRQMDKRLLEVQDEERRRIDQELHDEMGGLLTTLQMTTELGRMEAKNSSAPTQRFNEIEELVAQIASVTRTVSRRLHPRGLDEEGLRSALSTLIDDLEAQHDVQIRLQSDVEEGERFASIVEMTTFRIVQEALINVIRHAKTDAAEVTIEKSDSTLSLTVLDHGTGFDPSAQPEDDAYGLHGIRERIERLNGTLDITSVKDEGTRLSATLPRSISSLPNSSTFNTDS